MYDIANLLRQMPVLKASDLHLRVGIPPAYRINGDLKRAKMPELSQHDMEEMFRQMLSETQRERFDREYELDFALQLPTGERFRCNLFHQMETFAAVFRLINSSLPSFDDLYLPTSIKRISENRRGLVLVTGVTGSGKSTSLSAIIDYVNATRRDNIITIEDPVEFLHKAKKSIIAQREIGIDTGTFAEALRRAMRQDPDVILVGEIRDAETMQIALQAADTGHLVMSTLHTLDAVQTIYRILSFFPPHQHAEIRLVLSSVLKAIISQRLVPRCDRAGRVPAVEILVGTGAVKECIINPERTSSVKDLLAQGATQYGMQTIDQSLYFFYRRNIIDFDTCMQYATNPEDLKLRIAGIVGSSDSAWKEFEVKEEKEEDLPPGLTPVDAAQQQDEERPLAENKGY